MYTIDGVHTVLNSLLTPGMTNTRGKQKGSI